MTTATLVTIDEASRWATDHLKKEVTSTNISYLVQYGKVKKHVDEGSVLVDIGDLEKYYQSWRGKREANWKEKLGKDLNWALSFDYLREKDTTKHVHRLHPYKGKFIPQLVQYFIDDHTDDFKSAVYFKKGDIILDPFAGSGTTLVQAGEMGIHSIGIDVSSFNCMIGNVKLCKYDYFTLHQDVERAKQAITCYRNDHNTTSFESELMHEMYQFNSKHFPAPDFRYRIQRNEIDEAEYAEEKEREFLPTYERLVKKYGIALRQTESERFLDKWYCQNVREEIDFAFDLIKDVKDSRNKRALAAILSRTIRSCRATTHSDLATLKEPQLAAYYCWKHKKICKPLFSIKYWFDRYATDTLTRLHEYDRLRLPAHFAVLPADSRTVDINAETKERNEDLHGILSKQKIRGIFTSPPYVGQIDYHEQHAYAYDLFGFDRNDDLEIGPLYKGQGAEAKRSYVQGVADVLSNCEKYLQEDYNVFLVANDKHNLYPEIADKAGMKIVNRFKRPVLNRTERDRNPYSEIIFHLKRS